MQATLSTLPSGQTFLFHRVDIYRFIHKALRHCMSDTLVKLGATDADDAVELGEALAQVRELLVMCESHLDKENTYVHPAMEASFPSTSQRIADEHGHHDEEIAALHALADSAEQSAGGERARAVHALYHALSVFAGENFLHMHVEETAHNAVLWAAYSDEQLMEIEHTIVDSLTPEQKMAAMRWMLPALNASERVLLLADVRDHAPAVVLEAILSIARGCLAKRDFDKLERQLGLREPLAA